MSAPVIEAPAPVATTVPVMPVPVLPATPATPAPTPPAIVKPKPGKKKKEGGDVVPVTPVAPPAPVYTSGKALDVWKSSTELAAIPQLTSAMTLEERRGAIRTIATSAAGVDDRLNLVLGELLYEVAENGYHKTWLNKETGKNFETFEEYVQTELNMQKSKAHYVKKIYKVMVVDLDLSTEQLKDLEWSKAIHLLDVITKENAAELLGKAKALSVSGVKAMVAALKGKPAPGTESSPTPAAGSDESKVRMSFLLAPEQAENVKTALKVAESMSGSDVPANNLDLICSDFMAGTPGTGLAGAAANLDRIVKSVERSYGIKLIVGEMDKERYEKLKAESEAAAAAPAVVTPTK